MSPKHLRVIAIGVLLLLILWGASERWSLWSRRTQTISVSPRLPALTASDVDSVAITQGPDTVVLVKQPSGAWTVNRHPASLSGINDFFQALRDSVRPDLVAESPASFARMGVDTATGRLVRLSGGGKTLLQVFVGGPGPGSEGAYLRFASNTRVYLWPGRLPAVVRRSADDWRDRQIGAVVPESVAVVEIQRGAKRFTIKKEGSAWVLAMGARADSAGVARLLQSFRTISAAGFATDRQADSLTFARPERRVWVRGSGGRTFLSLAFDSAAGGFWARTPENASVYRLDFWRVDQLTPAEDALRSHP